MLADRPRKTRLVELSEFALVEVVAVGDTGTNPFVGR
jgi:hypothetical protein